MYNCAALLAFAELPGMRRLLYFFFSAAAVTTCSSAPWSQTGELVAPSGSAGDALGWSLAASLDGSLICVGAPGAGGGVGAVHTFVRAGAAWALASSFAPAPNETMGGSAYGASLALSADGATLLSGVYTSC